MVHLILTLLLFWPIAQLKLTQKDYDYFIFGHRHLPMEIKVGENANYLNLGDWIHYYTYGVFDENGLVLEKFEE